MSVVAASILLSFFALGYAAVRGSKLVRDALRRARDRQKQRLEARIENLLDTRAATFDGFFSSPERTERRPPSAPARGSTSTRAEGSAS